MKVTINLTVAQYGMVQRCIEHISANERSFDEEDEKLISEIAKIFHVEYNADANTNHEEEEGVESEVMLNFTKTLPTLSKIEPTKVVVHKNSVCIYYNKIISARDIEVADSNREFEKILGQMETDRLFLLDDYCFDNTAKVLELYLA